MTTRPEFAPPDVPSLTESVKAEPKTSLQKLVSRFQPALLSDEIVWRSTLKLALEEAYSKGQMDVISHYHGELTVYRDKLIAQKVDAQVAANAELEKRKQAEQRLAELEKPSLSNFFKALFSSIRQKLAW